MTQEKKLNSLANQLKYLHPSNIFVCFYINVYLQITCGCVHMYEHNKNVSEHLYIQVLGAVNYLVLCIEAFCRSNFVQRCYRGWGNPGPCLAPHPMHLHRLQGQAAGKQLCAKGSGFTVCQPWLGSVLAELCQLVRASSTRLCPLLGSSVHDVDALQGVQPRATTIKCLEYLLMRRG